MRVGSLEFTPTPLPSLVTALLLALLVSLGFWQLGRAGDKEALARAFEIQAHLPAVALTTLDPADPATRFRRVTAQGRYDTQHQVLLDNQLREGRSGIHVYTPLRLVDMDAAILVNRGWLPWGASRLRLPEVALTVDAVQVEGLLSQPANPGLKLEGQAENWPRLVSFLDYEQISQDLGYPLLPAVILLDPAAAHGYGRDWEPRFPGLGAERHRGYAVQWFALALALLVIYLGTNTTRRRCGNDEFEDHS